MAQVNYVREMESFSVYAEANGLTASERLVWLGLFHLFNARAFASEWPDQYIEIRRAELIAAAGVSKNTLLRAREKLAERGIIDYTIGGGDGGSRYRMVYLSVYGAPTEKEERTSSDRKNVAAWTPPLRDRGEVIAKIVGMEETDGGLTVKAVKVDPSQGGTTPSHDGTTKTGDVVTTENKPSVNVELNVEEEEIYNNKSTARARAGDGGSRDGGERNEGETNLISHAARDGFPSGEAFGRASDLPGDAGWTRADGCRGCEETALERAFQELIGRRASPAEARDIREIAAWCRAEDGLILEAIRRAGKAGAQSAGKYVTTCLMRWSDQDIRTAEELETWERLDDLSRSARPDIAARGREKLSAYTRELKIKHGMVTV